MAPIESRHSEMLLEDLIKEFEGDIVYDAHSLRASYSRSAARKELQRRGDSILAGIITHLLSGKSLNKYDLPEAWGFLIRAICRGEKIE